MVSLLTATHGRYSCMRRLLAMMLVQSHDDKEWIIFNNHPTPLALAEPVPWIRIINGDLPTLGHCRNELLKYANGEHLRVIDDDDQYLPWDLSFGTIHVGDNKAFKPKRSWWRCAHDFRTGPRYELAANAMEASVTWRTDLVKKIGFHTGNGDEWKFLHTEMHNGAVLEVELGEWSPYVYSWNDFIYHASGTIGNGRPDEMRAADWKKANQDVSSEPLTPDFSGVADHWIQMSRSVSGGFREEWLEAALEPLWSHLPSQDHRSTLQPRPIARSFLVAPQSAS